ncbi:MAG: hypothetical protein ACRED9_01745 [Caulobacteraceae bacterium]
MTLAILRELDFSAVDDLAFAAERGRLDVSNMLFNFESWELGPLLELYQLSEAGLGPNSLRGGWLDVGAFPGLGGGIVAPGARWTTGEKWRLGVLKTGRGDTQYEWTAFAMDAKRAAVSAGLNKDWAAQMVGALGEFHSNIYEHSEAEETGLIAFRSAPSLFEFVAADRGVGLLATLREAPEYGDLMDHGEALRLALTDGASRYGFDQGRGYGFRPLFTGLANRQASLRFRTGNASLAVDGTGPSLLRAQAGRKPHLPGVFISVACRMTAPAP